MPFALITGVPNLVGIVRSREREPQEERLSRFLGCNALNHVNGLLRDEISVVFLALRSLIDHRGSVLVLPAFS